SPRGFITILPLSRNRSFWIGVSGILCSLSVMQRLNVQPDGCLFLNALHFTHSTSCSHIVFPFSFSLLSSPLCPPPPNLQPQMDCYYCMCFFPPVFLSFFNHVCMCLCV